MIPLWPDPSAVVLPPHVTTIAIAAANEGIPVSAIARILSVPSGDVYEILNEQKQRGAIAEIPRADWPATARLADRLPAAAHARSDDDLAYLCHETFRLTNLEAGFLVVLLKADRVDKPKLHYVVETQRLARCAQPDKLESTDPKIVDVIICKLRKKLKTIDIRLTITTIWGGGYYVEPAVKSLVLDRITGNPHGRPDHQRAPVGGPAVMGDGVAHQ